MTTATSADGTAIAYDRIGSGPTLLLVTGALTDRSTPSSAALARLLADRFTVANVDRRGRGDSGDAAEYAVEREIEDLTAVIAHVGGPGFVCGFSSGAALALRAAAAGAPIGGLALYEPPFAASARPWLAEYPAEVTALLDAGRNGDAVALFLTRGVGLPAEAVDEMRQAPLWAGMEAIAPTLAYDLAIMGDSSVPVSLAREVPVPTLTLAGTASPDWLQAPARELAEAMPAARFRALPDQTHDVDPQVLAPVLAEFFGPLTPSTR